MMNDKILVRLIVPEIDFEFDLFIPINEQVWKVKRLIIKSIHDMIDVDISNGTGNITLLDKKSSEIYKNNDIVVNTNIRNSTELVVMPNVKK